MAIKIKFTDLVMAKRNQVGTSLRSATHFENKITISNNANMKQTVLTVAGIYSSFAKKIHSQTVGELSKQMRNPLPVWLFLTL